ncbi:MAG: D-2-hydroxyacid dehydrogenase [Halobacteriales archaeon]
MPSQPKTLITHTVSRSGAAALREALTDRLDSISIEHTTTPPGTREAIVDAEIALTFGYDDAMLEAAQKLRWLQALSAGVNSYDLEHLEAEDIILTNASGVHAQPIAEQVLGYMLMFDRRIHTGIKQQARGVWESYGAHELRGKTVGIVGVGAIGTRVAELADALGVTPIGLKRDPTDAPDVLADVFGPDGLYEVLDRSDYVVLACPLTEETRGMIGETELRTMPSHGVLINIARGAIVKQDELAEELQEGHIRGAALDVFEEEPLPADSPLWDLSNVVITPHMAGSTPQYWDRAADLFADNYERYQAGAFESFENRIV